jgi:hypothetical protein
MAGQIKRREVFASRLLCQLRGQTVFVPQGRPKIARSFNCGKRHPTNQAPEGRQEKMVAENSAAPAGLAGFYHVKPAVETAGYFHPRLRRWVAMSCVQTPLLQESNRLKIKLEMNFVSRSMVTLAQM